MSTDTPPPASPARRAISVAKWLAIPLAIGALAAGRWFFAAEEEGPRRRGGEGPTPVEVADVEVTDLSAMRELTGTLEPSAEVVVAAEVAGTVEAVNVDLSDTVTPADVLATLDGRDYRQAAAATRAQLAVARAQAEAAEHALGTAQRTLERTEALGERGVASQARLDEARAALNAARAAKAVADAEVARARAAHSDAQLDVERTRVRGRWSEEAGARHVASRQVDEGARVSVGDALFTLIDTDPLVLAVMVTPEDYERFAVGQRVALRGPTGREMDGRVARVAPSFDPESRQARVEIEVANPEGAIPPGAFVRSRAVLRTLEDATVIPAVALTRRDGQQVVFAVEGEVARMVPVEPLLRSEGRVAVRAEGLSGRVVTLGHQRLSDGAAVRVTGSSGAAVAGADADPAEPDG